MLVQQRRYYKEVGQGEGGSGFSHCSASHISSLSCQPGCLPPASAPVLFCVCCCLTPCLLSCPQFGILVGWLHWLPTLPLCLVTEIDSYILAQCLFLATSCVTSLALPTAPSCDPPTQLRPVAHRLHVTLCSTTPLPGLRKHQGPGSSHLPLQFSRGPGIVELVHRKPWLCLAIHTTKEVQFCE